MNSKLSLSVRRVRSTLRTGVDTGSSFVRTAGANQNQGGSSSADNGGGGLSVGGHPSTGATYSQPQAHQQGVVADASGYAY